jgi:hypothetical protein
METIIFANGCLFIAHSVFVSRIKMQNKVIRSGNHSNTDATKLIRFFIGSRKHSKIFKVFFDDPANQTLFSLVDLLCFAYFQPY